MDCPIQTSYDGGKGPNTVRTQHFDANEVGLLCHAEGLAADCAGDVGAVAVAVAVVVIGKVRAEGCAAFEVVVFWVDALRRRSVAICCLSGKAAYSINDICIRPLTGGAIVDVCICTLLSVADAGEPVRRILLRDQIVGLDDLILLNEDDIVIIV